jgi:ribosomal protein L7Ae-like RNA K-turn-binding protein
MKRSRGIPMLGLARRAGAVAAGTDAARKAVREGRAFLVVLASDASPGQLKKLLPLVERTGVPHCVWGTRAELGGAIGTGLSSAVAITEASLAGQVESSLLEEAGLGRS